MGSKSNPGKFDCYANAHPDEQMFVLLGRDPTGGSLTRLWAAAREQLGEDPAKVAEARSCAAAMDAWCRQVGKEPADVLDLLPFELLAQAIRRRKGVVMVQVREQDGDKLVLPNAPLVPTIVLQGHQVATLYNLEGGRTGIAFSIGFGNGPSGQGMYAWIGSDASRAIPLFEQEPDALWAVHVSGMDDVHAAPSRAEAQAAADQFNGYVEARKDKHPLDPHVHATVTEYPYSPAQHAEALAKWPEFYRRPAAAEQA